MVNSVLDRLAHNAHQVIIESESYGQKKGINVKTKGRFDFDKTHQLKRGYS